MINFFTEIILIVLMGIAMGIFGTLLFFRLDKSWKQLLLGIGSLFSAGGLGRAFIYYLEIPKNSAALFFFDIDDWYNYKCVFFIFKAMQIIEESIWEKCYPHIRYSFRI